MRKSGLVRCVLILWAFLGGLTGVGLPALHSFAHTRAALQQPPVPLATPTDQLPRVDRGPWAGVYLDGDHDALHSDARFPRPRAWLFALASSTATEVVAVVTAIPTAPQLVLTLREISTLPRAPDLPRAPPLL